MEPFNFASFFEAIQEWPANWKIAIQVLESRLMKALFVTNEDWNSFKEKVEDLAWEEREYNISTLAQEVRDMVIQLPKIEYTSYRERVRRSLKGIYGEIAVDMTVSFGLNTDISMLTGDIVFQIDGLAKYCEKLAEIDLREAAREFIDKYNGELSNIKSNRDWMRKGITFYSRKI